MSTSWYSVARPYMLQAPGQQAPLPPGAPDFPPVNIAVLADLSGHPVRQEYQDSSACSEQTGYPGVKLPAPRRYSHGQSPHPSAAGPGKELGWIRGHQAARSQPILPTSAPEVLPAVLEAGRAKDMAARPVSPRLQLGESALPQETGLHAALQQYPSRSSYAAAIRTPQTRRSTLPSPLHYEDSSMSPSMLPVISHPISSVYETPQQHQLPRSGQSHSLPHLHSAAAGTPATGKRPLPSLPSGIPSTVSLSKEHTQPSPVFPYTRPLFRTSSVASNASESSVDSTRRPLPKPPNLPSLQNDRQDCSTAESPRMLSSIVENRSWEDPNHTISLPSSEIAKAKTAEGQDSPSSESRDTGERSQITYADTSKYRNGVAHEAIAPPKIPIPVPTFAFESEAEDTGIHTEASISISVAPPSPGLSKATSDDYFEAALEDERHPLPVSSVPMATSTKPYALACPGCGKAVLYGRTVNAMGKRWHPDCFKCASCAIQLEHLEFFTKDAKPYCHVDYHEVGRPLSFDM